MPRITPVHWKVLECIFEKAGFVFERQASSHRSYTKEGIARPIIIPTYNQISPDIIILDFMMPEIDGAMAVKTIRTFSEVPILILSALDNPGMVVQALDAGADDYLIKPVPSSVLIAHIRTLVRRATIQVGSLMKCPI